MFINYIIVLFSSFFLSVVFIGLFKRIVLMNRLFSQQRIPLIGGISMGLSFVLSCLLGFQVISFLSRPALGILISSIFMLAFGLIDDYRELSILAKFLVQFIATSLLIFFGIRTHIVYIGEPLNIIITFIWVIGITNAFNHLDVLDGLAAAASIIISFAFFTFSIFNSDITIAILTLALAGSIFGFLIYNLPPAKVYMGNSGSHFLGFVLAAIALIISYATLEKKIVLLSPLFILGLPIFDTAFLILMRISKKKLPFKKSNDHLPLRFLGLGYSKRKTLFIMLFLCLFFSLSGILLSQLSSSFGVAIIVFVVIVTLALMKRMSKIAVYD